MLGSMKDLLGYSLETIDGGQGAVNDFYFDDSWHLRYLVADTRKWLPGRLVLISPAAFIGPDRAAGVFRLDISRETLKHSPEVNADLPLSRAEEARLSGYYGWPQYWMGVPGATSPGYAVTGIIAHPMPPPLGAEGQDLPPDMHINPHLRSARDVIGWPVRATDGDVGHVDDLLVRDTDWAIHSLVIDTRNWLPGRKVLITPAEVRDLARHRDPTRHEPGVALDLTRDQVKDAPPFERPPDQRGWWLV